MIRKTIHKLLRHRHFWRDITFDELSEIYASQFLRSLARNVISIFVPVYLYKIGHSLPDLFLMYFVWFAIRPLFCVIVAKIIARFGPKHTIALSDVLYVAFLSVLITVETMHWPLWFIAFVGSLATTTFLVAFQVDFSKIKHKEHGGKELGYEHIFERIGAILGPAVGGLVATFIDPRYTIAVAILLLIASLVPIFMTAEPIHTRQHITYKDFPWRRHKWDFISGASLHLDIVITTFFWMLFIVVTVLTENTYAALGILTAISTGIALTAIMAIGRLVDEQKGGLLLKIGVICNSVLHLFRPFVANIGSVLAVKTVNEPVATAFHLPYEKGRYDAADTVTGYRIAYFSLVNIIDAVVIAIFMLAAWFLTLSYDPITILKGIFIFGALNSLIIMSQKYLALRDN